MESERRVSSCDRLLAPCDGFRVDLDAFIAAAEVVHQPEREIADPRTDIKNTVFGLKAAKDELRPHRVTCLGERLRMPRSIVVLPQVSWRQQSAASAARDAVQECADAVERVPATSGDAFPTWPCVRRH